MKEPDKLCSLRKWDDPDRLRKATGEELIWFGRRLDERPPNCVGPTLCHLLARSLLRARTRDGATVGLRANPVQRAFETRRGRRNIVLKARQMGLTTWVAARFFIKTITQPGTVTLQVAHTQDAAEEIFCIVHRFLDQMPWPLKKRLLMPSRANVRLLSFPRIDSQYMVVSAAERNAGRGLTVRNLHCSELARWPGDPAETLAGLRAALTPDGEEVLESTPNGVGGCFHEEWLRARETGIVRHFFPWWMEQEYRADPVDPASLSDEERGLMEGFCLDLEQIGFRRRMRANFRGLARQEYAEDSESCFRTSGDAVFELDAVEARLKTVPDPTEQRRNGELQIWLPPLSNRKYLVAVDPAGGGSEGDYSAAQVLETSTGLQCAEFAGHVGGLELARIVTDLAAEYNHGWLIVERNNHGSGVLALADAVCGYRRIYFGDSKAGWLTNSVSRPAMLGRLNAALVEQPDCFQSRRLLSECRSFVRTADGRAEARPGTHDDLIMAMAIALAARAELLTASR